MSNWLVMTKPKQLEYYRGVLIHADTSLHEQAIKHVRKFVPQGSSVLDLGAGAGAFSMRLVDNGYHVTALDIDPEKWVPKDIEFVKLNIDLGVSGSIDKVFDAVCCLEVIEHVENPWNLLREVYAVLKPGGYLILSTPNITSFVSRLNFLRTGQFHQFGEADLEYGHINPMTEFEMRVAASQVGWKVVKVSPGGYLPVFDLSSMRLFRLLLNVARGLVYVVAKGQKRGWCLFFIMRKPLSNTNSNYSPL